MFQLINHELHESHEFYINAKFNFFVKFVRFVVLKNKLLVVNLIIKV